MMDWHFWKPQALTNVSSLQKKLCVSIICHSDSGNFNTWHITGIPWVFVQLNCVTRLLFTAHTLLAKFWSTKQGGFRITAIYLLKKQSLCRSLLRADLTGQRQHGCMNAHTDICIYICTQRSVRSTTTRSMKQLGVLVLLWSWPNQLKNLTKSRNSVWEPHQCLSQTTQESEFTSEIWKLPTVLSAEENF